MRSLGHALDDPIYGQGDRGLGRPSGVVADDEPALERARLHAGHALQGTRSRYHLQRTSVSYELQDFEGDLPLPVRRGDGPRG